MRAILARGLAIGLLALTSLVVASGLFLSYAFPDPEVSNRLGLPFGFLSHIAYAAVGALIVNRQTRNTVGWLLICLGLNGAILALTEIYEPIVNANALAPVGPEVRRTVSDLTWVIWMAVTSLVLQLFPAGRPLSPRWRYLAWLAGIWLLLGVVVVLARLPQDGLLNGLMFGLLLVLLVLSIASILLRAKRASGVERQQIKWLAFGAVPALLVVPFLASQFPQAFPLQQIFFMWLPLTIGIAVLRYRLYDIDRLVNRTVVYATVSVLLAAVYGASVLLLQIPLSQIAPGDSLTVAASTLVVFALFQPLRRRVKSAIDRRFDRARYDAERTAAAFAGRLRDEVDLNSIVQDLRSVVGSSLQPGSASVWIRARNESRTLEP